MRSTLFVLTATLANACAPESAGTDGAEADDKRPSSFCTDHPTHHACVGATPAYDCTLTGITVTNDAVDLAIANVGSATTWCVLDFQLGFVAGGGVGQTTSLFLSPGQAFVYSANLSWWGVDSSSIATVDACSYANVSGSSYLPESDIDEDPSNDCTTS
jgi:hypothetical protein